MWAAPPSRAAAPAGWNLGLRLARADRSHTRERGNSPCTYVISVSAAPRPRAGVRARLTPTPRGRPLCILAHRDRRCACARNTRAHRQHDTTQTPKLRNIDR
eukprot:7212665-Prymnesium_polylepis.1